MKTSIAIAVIALATGCAATDDRNVAQAEPRFADHEGRPTGHHAAHSGSGSDDDDDPWWSSVLGDLIGGFFGFLFSKDDDKPAEAPFKPWPADTGGL